MLHDTMDSEFLLKMGTLIATKRRLLRIKEVDLAKTADISQAALSNIENGNCPGPKLIIINRLFHYLKISWSELPPPPIELINYLFAA